MGSLQRTSRIFGLLFTVSLFTSTALAVDLSSLVSRWTIFRLSQERTLACAAALSFPGIPLRQKLLPRPWKIPTIAHFYRDRSIRPERVVWHLTFPNERRLIGSTQFETNLARLLSEVEGIELSHGEVLFPTGIPEKLKATRYSTVLAHVLNQVSNLVFIAAGIAAHEGNRSLERVELTTASALFAAAIYYALKSPLSRAGWGRIFTPGRVLRSYSMDKPENVERVRSFVQDWKAQWDADTPQTLVLLTRGEIPNGESLWGELGFQPISRESIASVYELPETTPDGLP